MIDVYTLSSKDVTGGGLSKSTAIQHIQELESLCADLELFTNSGSWTYNSDTRTIIFSTGGYHLLGILQTEKPMALSLLECMCVEDDRKLLLDFLAPSHPSNATQSVQIPIQDSFGNQIKIAMCARDHTDSANNIRYGLIKLIP